MICYTTILHFSLITVVTDNTVNGDGVVNIERYIHLKIVQIELFTVFIFDVKVIVLNAFNNTGYIVLTGCEVVVFMCFT